MDELAKELIQVIIDRNGEISTLNERVTDVEKGQIKIVGSIDNLASSLNTYMEEGLAYRKQVDKNSLVRQIFTAIVCLAGGIGTIAGAIWTVSKVVKI